MRKSLLDSFDQIYILNLHGYYLRTSPDGSKDENVFDIRQGVTISFFIKNESIKEKGIYYSELFGQRIDKYRELFRLEKDDVDWKKLKLDNKYYFFKPFDYVGLKRYEQSFRVNEIFQKYGTGVKTDRDELFFDLNKDNLTERIKTLLNNPSADFKKKYNVKDSSSYKLTKKIQGKKFDESLIVDCNYRPFDLRYLYYDTSILSRPNNDTFQHILNKKNLILTVKRQNKFEPFSYAFILDNITESCFFESSFANNSIFPLYLYSGKEKTLNFSKQFSDFINEQYKSAFTPEEILSYIYAVLHSPTYRSKYAEFLKIDFPRIPFTDDKKLFKKLSALGEELINVHLLKEEPDYSFGIFIGKGNNVVEKINFVSEKKSGKLYINDTQYFDNIPQEIYDFNIGGYQVLDHYLKERKGRNILLDIENIEKSVKAIAHTIDQMKKIDTLTKNWI